MRVLMVCLGNICRSPTAHGVFEALLLQRGLASQFYIDSAGTADYHIGKTPDLRTIDAAAKRGYDLSQLVARQISSEDLEIFDYIFAMDAENLQVVESLKSQTNSRQPRELGLFLSLSEEGMDNVPDPYYRGEEGFELVLDLIEAASERWLHKITGELNLSPIKGR
ncbi:MAG: low molecular weight protein-tyrosine-phosphatase [Pseudohongiellaceae bacterium]